MEITIASWPRKSFFLRSALNKLLGMSMAFSVSLLVVRVIHTHRLNFAGLVWNLCLAWIPWFFSQWLTDGIHLIRKKYLFLMAFFGWLIFLPNTFYIVTDLFHLIDETDITVAPMWFDLVLIFSFAWNGMMLGILSIRQMEKLMARFYPRLTGLIFLSPVMWLNALGIYIGRYLRYNSWDVLTNPLPLARDITQILLHPLIFHDAWSMTGCYSILMTLVYLMLKKLASAQPSGDNIA